MKNTPKKRIWSTWIIIGFTGLAVFLLGLFLSSIIERRAESVLTFQIVSPLPEWEPRNEVWGENFPREYESYSETQDTSFSSLHGGGAWRDYLEEIPQMVILWAGYGFSVDYNQGRGHFYSVLDIRNSLRTSGGTPATCWTCKSTDVPRLMNSMGIAEFYEKKWTDLGGDVLNAIGCQDCHDSKTMNLRLTRPALVEALQRQGEDMDSISHQEMRSLVCAQCHSEYYFKGEGKYLTFPWDKGLSVEDMEAYYDGYRFTEWTHKLSQAPMIKAQHPDYELFMTGIHADRGVSCADCHMPYKSEGGLKFTDHKIQSPLNNIANSCQVCHRESEEKLRQNVYERQNTIQSLRILAEDALSKAHIEAQKAWESGAREEKLSPALALIRQSQWYWDWVAAANSLGFHAPLESARILANSIQKAEEARRELAVILRERGVKTPLVFPDISTKDKALEYIGVDLEAIINSKKEFLDTIASQWTKPEKPE